MLTIRPDTIQALEAGAHADFVRRLRQHLRRHFPETCAAMGEQRLMQFIEYGIRRAREWEFTLEPDIARYIGLMATFGHRFDRDESLPWARHILASKAPPDPSQRMTRLTLAARDALLPPGRRL